MELRILDIKVVQQDLIPQSQSDVFELFQKNRINLLAICPTSYNIAENVNKQHMLHTYDQFFFQISLMSYLQNKLAYCSQGQDSAAKTNVEL